MNKRQSKQAKMKNQHGECRRKESHYILYSDASSGIFSKADRISLSSFIVLLLAIIGGLFLLNIVMEDIQTKYAPLPTGSVFNVCDVLAAPSSFPLYLRRRGVLVREE